MTENGFAELIDRLRDGDQQAATDLVRDFEPEIRRFIRFRLTDSSLRRAVDSLDICQSVMARFFVQLSAGNLELNDPIQLRTLLITMARNKLYDKIRREQADRRDYRRLAGDGEVLEGVAADQETPSQIAIGDELVQIVRSHLTAEEQYLIDQKLSGREWADLAAELGVTAEALRKRATRAMDRAAQALGLAGDSL